MDNYLNRNIVSHIHATPTFLAQYDFSNVASLRRLISGGDLLDQKWFNKSHFY